MFIEKLNTPTFTRLPTSIRRGIIRALWRVDTAIKGGDRIGVEGIFRKVLRMSAADARRLSNEYTFHDVLNQAGWAALLNANAASFKRDVATVTIEQPAVFEQIAQDRRPVILAPLHMGCFALPFTVLMKTFFNGRSMLILRAREDRNEETRTMQRIAELGVAMRFLNVRQKQNYVDAVRFARDGAVIVTFVDLPASYGSPAPVSLFGQPAQIATGIMGLARVAGATVLPMCVTSTLDGDTVHVSRPYESYRNDDDEKARIADSLKRHIEESVLRAPEQWHMWPRFGEYIDQSASEGVAA